MFYSQKIGIWLISSFEEPFNNFLGDVIFSAWNFVKKQDFALYAK